MTEDPPAQTAVKGHLTMVPAVDPQLVARWMATDMAQCLAVGAVPAPASTKDSTWADLGADDLLLIEATHLPGLEALAVLANRTAVVVWTPLAGADPTLMRSRADWVRRGVQEVLTADELAAPEAAWRLMASSLRHRHATAARRAYATDLATGLPHQQQLIEHMSHLLALREREPAPMALLVLRIEGLATAEARLGAEAASSLRRKLAVRLRSALRASDVVASIGGDSFAVLLAWIDTVADADGVAAKLTSAVQRPFSVAGQPVAFAVSVGQGRYPDDGKDAGVLLQRAVQQAAVMPGVGRSGHANIVERGVATAANDDTV